MRIKATQDEWKTRFQVTSEFPFLEVHFEVYTQHPGDLLELRSDLKYALELVELALSEGKEKAS